MSIGEKTLHGIAGRRAPAGKLTKLLACGLVLATAACGTRGERQSEPTSSTTEALTTQSYEIRLPEALTPEQVIFGARGNLLIEDAVDLRTLTSAKAQVSNAATGQTAVGVTATPGNVYSVANVFLRDRSHVFGFVRTTGSVTQQNQVVVDGGIQQGVSLDVRTATSFELDVPDPSGDVILEPDRFRAISPGSYGQLVVKSRSQVELLQSGIYFFTSFDLEPQASLKLDNANGPIYIFVQGGQLIYRGAFIKQNASLYNVLLGYAGTTDLAIEQPFSGTILAPNAKINLATTAAGHFGSFFGKSIQAFPNTLYHLRPFDPGDCRQSAAACTVTLGCADANDNGKVDCAECPGLGQTSADLDGDLTPDCLDACPADPNKSAPGDCGCFHPDTDRDGDGLLDCRDGCPDDPTNAECTTRDDLPEPLDVPTPPNTDADPQTPVDPNNCFGTLPASPSDPDFVPTKADLDATLASVPELGAPCDDPQDLERCEPDPMQVLDTSCADTVDPTLGNDSLCPSGYVCRLAQPTSCLTTPVPELCENGNKTWRCAKLDPECLIADPPSTDTDPSSCATPEACPCVFGLPGCSCNQFDVCPDDGFTGDTGPTDPTVYEPDPQPTSQVIEDAKHTPDPVFTDPPESLTCERGISGNCWCKMGMANPPSLTDGNAKNAHHGGGSIIDLEFNPDAHFSVDIRPRPFGELTFDVDASTMFVAKATATLPIAGTHSATFVDLKAGVHAERCRLSTGDTHFKVFNLDFVDMFGLEPFDTQSTEPGNEAMRAAGVACSNAIATFQERADRAKKALRDAQELIELYRALPANTTFERAEFCALVESGDPEFPLGNCETDRIEATINRYVTYYENRVTRMLEAGQDIALATQSFGALLSAATGGRVTFLDIHRSESVTVVDFTFFVGPVPVNISLDLMSAYGIDGDLLFHYSPPSGLGLGLDQTAEIASVGGSVRPSASAGVALFAGVGFGVPGFSVKAGIRGELTLAKITANLQAGVGLSIKSLEDTREIPGDLLAVSTGGLLVPKRQYEIFGNWYYSVGLGLSDVLSGTINAYVKLKALFFSKTFKKTIISFDDPFDLSLDVKLLEGGGRLPGIELPVPGLAENTLGAFEMQLPFVQMVPLPVPTTPEPTTTVPFDVPDDKPLHFEGTCNTPPVP